MSMFRVFLSVSLCFCVSNGFLLETNTKHTANLTGMNKQYVTLNEFYEAKNENQYDLNVLSHKMERMKSDSEKTLALLTSQIQEKLFSIENSFKVNGKMNDTNELQQLKRIISELEDKNTKLQHNFEILQRKYEAIQNELLQSRNTTAKLSKDFQTIQQLKTVHQLQDLNAMKQDVQSISSQTQSLAVNQQARNQDFIALYNQTLLTQNNLYSLGQQQEDFKNQTLTSLQNIRRNQNTSKLAVNGKIYELARNINRTTDRVDKANEKVAVTACIRRDRILSSGEAILFDNVRSHVGIDNLSEFTSTGKFTCSKNGLYLVSIWVLVNKASNGHQFSILKNSTALSDTYIGISNHYDTGPATVAVELQVYDKVWVGYPNGYIANRGTCMTIIKIM